MIYVFCMIKRKVLRQRKEGTQRTAKFSNVAIPEPDKTIEN